MNSDTSITIRAYMIVAVFIGSYLYCIGAHGFLLGLGFGWIPAAIVAWLAGFILGLFRV